MEHFKRHLRTLLITPLENLINSLSKQKLALQLRLSALTKVNIESQQNISYYRSNF